MKQGKGLILGGGPDGGKTHLISAMLHYAAMDGLSVGYTTMKGFFLSLRDAIGSDRKSEKDTIDRFAGYQVLAIDDLDVFKSAHGDYQYDSLWMMIDRRYSNKLATLAATNLDAKELKEQFDERIRRRLDAEVVQVPKTDWSKIK